MKILKSKILHAFVTLAILVPVSVYAEEGGSGHYAPGGAASFIDQLPGKPGWAIANFFNYYKGDASASKQFFTGGLLTAGLDATAYSDTVVALYQTPLQLLGGYYSVGLAVPYVWLDVKGNVQVTGPIVGSISGSKSDKANGFGDIVVYPFMLGWTGLNGDLKCDVRLGIYAPTGDYEKDKLANVGKNYWTFEPMVSMSWISSKIGLELTGFAGMDFNTENTDTDYHTGNQFHVDLTVAEHLPLFGGIIGIGANGFYYEQVTGDSGAGTKFVGDFKGRTMGVGPVVSYATKVSQKDLVAEVKWLTETDVTHRLKGDYLWFKVGLLF